MINKLASKLSLYFIKIGQIKKDEKDAYDYCFEILLSTLLNGVFLLVVGFISGCFIITLLFMISFLLIRSASGGFHAQTHFRCFMTLVIDYFFLIVLLKILPENYLLLFTVVITLISALIIFFISPAEHENHPLDKEQKQSLSRKSQTLSILMSLIIIVLIMGFNKTDYAFSISYGMFSVGISVLYVKLKNHKCSANCGENNI